MAISPQKTWASQVKQVSLDLAIWGAEPPGQLTVLVADTLLKLIDVPPKRWACRDVDDPPPAKLNRFNRSRKDMGLLWFFSLHGRYNKERVQYNTKHMSDEYTHMCNFRWNTHSAMAMFPSVRSFSRVPCLFSGTRMSACACVISEFDEVRRTPLVVSMKPMNFTQIRCTGGWYRVS